MIQNSTVFFPKTSRMYRPSSVKLSVFGLVWCLSLFASSFVSGQNDRCDPTKVVGSESCARCHVNESAAWKLTPHCRTFEELGRSPEAQKICSKMGIRSVKRSDLCIDCHFTAQTNGDKVKPISGISCESCHGPAKEWVNTHNQYLSPTGNKEGESPQQRTVRLAGCSEKGMYNTGNLYQIASNCLNCHTIPNESLVNVGGHKPTAEDFEFVRWSQGSIRHNFMRTAGVQNAQSSAEQLRVMYVVGLIADLEYSTRATAKATQKSTFGLSVAGRAARVAKQLFDIQQQINDPQLQQVLQAFVQADLKLNNQKSLESIADQIRSAGEGFAVSNDGKRLAAVDALLPKPSEYR